jgi:hypothetical protein
MKDKVLLYPVVVVVVVLVAGLAACGGTTEPPREESAPAEALGTEEAPAATSAACSLLTAEEIREVLGEAPAPPQTPEGTDECLWSSSEDPARTLVRVTTSDSGYPSYESFVTSYQAEFGGEQPPTEYYRPIQGVGDWAMYVADENAIQVFKGGRMVQIAPHPPNEAHALALAQKAVARLQ